MNQTLEFLSFPQGKLPQDNWNAHRNLISREDSTGLLAHGRGPVLR